MDMFSIFGSIWKFKKAVLPVIAITLVAVAYILVIKPPTYESKAAILLTAPPAAPTTAQIAADPGLARVNSNNPYVSLGNLVLVADVVIEVVQSPAAKNEIVAAGADPAYEIALDVSFESPPAIDVTGEGTNAESAIRSAQVVASQVIKDLRQMQQSQGVNSKYMIQAIEYVQPTAATSSSSSKLRSLIGIIAFGAILLLVAVSIAQTLEGRKTRRGKEHQRKASAAPTNQPVRDSYGTIPADNGGEEAWPGVRQAELQSPYSRIRPEGQVRPEVYPMGGNRPWDQLG
jgi:hypothetical protein